MSGRSRTGATRAEILSTLGVLALAAVAVFALWPRSVPPPAPAAGADVPAAVRVADAELAGPRADAALDPCPVGAGPGSGPLAEVAVPCLGAPGTVDLGAALAGEPALLNVWATWCGPCRDELPALQDYAGRPGSVPVIGLNVRDDPRAALGLLTELGITFPSVTGDALRGPLDIPPLLPVSYVLGADGSAVRVDPPTPFADADEVAAAVEGHLRR